MISDVVLSDGGSALTIRGHNFLDPVAVLLTNGLEEVPVPSAEFVDSGTIRAPLPAGLPPGLLSVFVTNRAGTPQAIRTALPNAVMGSPPVWLPNVEYP